jgi:hypothetical protein
MTAAAKKSLMVKQAVRMVAGAVTGAGSVILFMEAGGKTRLGSDDPGVVVALIAGLIYALMSLIVGLGAVAPRPGAVFLNVEDADELREQRSSLLPSAAAGVLFGLFLLVLAMAPEQGSGGDAGGWLAAAASLLGAGILVTVLTKDRGDELIRQIALEAGSLTLHIAITIACVWGMLAQLGYARWITPLGLIGGLALLYLGAIFWLAGRKGLMKGR